MLELDTYIMRTKRTDRFVNIDVATVNSKSLCLKSFCDLCSGNRAIETFFFTDAHWNSNAEQADLRCHFREICLFEVDLLEDLLHLLLHALHRTWSCNVRKAARHEEVTCVTVFDKNNFAGITELLYILT